MKLAELVSTRSTCNRKNCGCVITKNNRIISTGYNGSDKNQPHCDEAGHFMVEGSCKRTIHAEENCLNFARETNETLEGCKLYSNTYPCWNCFGKIVSAGIKEIYYKDSYRENVLIEEYAKFKGIKIVRIPLS